MAYFTVVVALFSFAFLLKYIYWKYQVYSYQKNLGLPIAYAYFVSPLLPSGEYFGKPSEEEQQRLIIETSEKTGSPFVITVNGGFFSLKCW
jgi:hypothetical protein